MEDIQGFKELEPNSQVAELIAYIESELTNWVSSPEFVHITKTNKRENRHSEAFCAYMTCKCKSHFYFARETDQLRTSAIDIGVRLCGNNLIYTIEAKILPTPRSSKKDKRNEYEYVYGHGGGIQRFKDGRHGLDDELKPFSECGLIAYIKQNDFDYWFDKINNWISDAEWPESEKLVKTYFGSCAKLASTHHRLDKSELLLHHFWVIVESK